METCLLGPEDVSLALGPRCEELFEIHKASRGGSG